QSAPQPGGNVLGIERTIFDTQGQQKSLSCTAQRRTGQSAPQPGGNVLGIERTIFDTQGQQKSLSCTAQR
ncbi:hypothetical protein C0U44_32420, partial [Klebsiella pneumoniae]